ncbi:MarR family winged helix-turn-helix transcriptional regulator [Winogradskya consettensis]|uniref:MarR family transcriptional regulator n=2 Tax=Winogradskya consettensis TaxID=113560 RepID=A0A919VP07_9ACTN|nr:MarR family transcriptional regulator [Actinoplanes consettensis]
MTDAHRDGMSQGDRVVDALRVYSADYSELTHYLARWLGVHSADATAFSEIVYAQESAEPLSPIKLSKRIGLTSGATTSLLNRLEDAGLIVRSREHSDRRMVTLRSTPDVGRDAAAVFDPVAERIDAMMQEYSPEFLQEVESLLDHLHTVIGGAIQNLQSKAPKSAQRGG